MKKTFAILNKLKQSQFMGVAAESSNSLHREECNFNLLVLNRNTLLDLFGCINYTLTPKYTTGKLIAI